MKDESIGSDVGAPEMDAESSVKVYASLASLAVEGTAPEIGDEVEISVRGTVASLDGDVACISPTEVNGQPAPMPPSEAPMDNHDELERMASDDDEGRNY